MKPKKPDMSNSFAAGHFVFFLGQNVVSIYKKKKNLICIKKGFNILFVDGRV